jgi:hypothetical protein
MQEQEVQHDVENPMYRFEWVEDMEEWLAVEQFAVEQRQLATSRFRVRTLPAGAPVPHGHPSTWAWVDADELIRFAQDVYNHDRDSSSTGGLGPSGGPATEEELIRHYQRLGRDGDGEPSDQDRLDLYHRKWARIAHLGFEEVWHAEEDREEALWRWASIFQLKFGFPGRAGNAYRPVPRVRLWFRVR